MIVVVLSPVLVSLVEALEPVLELESVAGVATQAYRPYSWGLQEYPV